MAFMWLLLSIVFVAVVCTAHEIAKSWQPKVQRSAVVIHRPRDRPIAVTPSSTLGRYTAKWFSMKDCERLLDSSDKVIFIAIRGDFSEDSLPLPELISLSIAPNELAEVLHWLPPGQSVVLCGQVDLCSSTIRPAEVNAGTPHIYVLQSQPVHSMAG
jgi:hypothetical protein